MKKQEEKKAQMIWKRLSLAKKMVINVHRRPDLDSVGSATALAQVLEKQGKKVKLICPHQIPEEFLFLKKAREIKTVDFANYYFHPDEIFVVLDSAASSIITGDTEAEINRQPDVVIDHHEINSLISPLKFVRKEASATAEILYDLFSFLKVEIDKDIATSLLAGILGDTVFLRYPNSPLKIFKIIDRLLEKGADYQKIIFHALDSFSFLAIKLLGKFLEKMEIVENKKTRFVFSAVNFEEYFQFGCPQGVREMAADLYFRSFKNIDLGVVGLEEEKGKMVLSFRSKGEIDVSQLAKIFGGGGHKHAAGATLEGSFDKVKKEVVKKIFDYFRE